MHVGFRIHCNPSTNLLLYTERTSAVKYIYLFKYIDKDCHVFKYKYKNKKTFKKNKINISVVGFFSLGTT